MALTKEVLDQYFEKSERLNLLQARIHSYTTSLKRKYEDKAKEKIQSKIPKEMLKVELFSKTERVSIEGGDLVFLWGIDGDRSSRSSTCLFYFERFGKIYINYDLTKENLPSDTIEPIYNSLLELIELMRCADEAIAAEIEQDILTFLQ